MGLIKHFLDRIHAGNKPELLPVIERAVTAVAPHLKQTRGYPADYLKPVTVALEYARDLASSIPGPVVVDNDSYASDAFVHAIFPSADSIPEALRSSRAVLEYHQKFPGSNEIYALMGMRREEKCLLGMELAGEVIQRGVPLNVVYFTSHTIEEPAPSEQQAREQIAWNFFDKLIYRVAKRIETRKLEKQELLHEKDLLTARLHAASPGARPELEAELLRVLEKAQSVSSLLDLGSYLEDFESVFLNPDQYLQLVPSPVFLDNMGVKKSSQDISQGEPVVFNDLIGYDFRDWTVAMVHCRNIPHETFAARLEDAHRRLSIFPAAKDSAG